MSWSFYLVHILVNLHAEFISMFTLELFDLPGSFAHHKAGSVEIYPWAVLLAFH